MKNISNPILVAMVAGLLITIINPVIAQEKYKGNNFVSLKPGSSEEEIIEKAAQVTPSGPQLEWQQLESTAFIHFGINTFYNQERGNGTEDPARFNLRSINTDQWAKVVSEAGLKMMILTCKHHDGFCLWPSKFSSHSVASSPWLQGKGDVVKQVTESCRKYNLKFGIYLSPWDMHEPSYGNSSEYNSFFINQLTELLTNYGKVDEVWFDGACGEGPNGKKQEYDWSAYYSLIRKLQPNAVIAIMGPDVRWVGTESGYGRETEWSVVPYTVTNQENISDKSQHTALSEGFIPVDFEKQDLGSRDMLTNAKNLIWYPSEVDVSIRPGWFWHENENSKVKSPEKLMDVYINSIGRNSLLLLNIPPDTEGQINESDIKSLNAWKDAVAATFKTNYAQDAIFKASNNQEISKELTDKNDATSWNPEISDTYLLEAEMKTPSDFSLLLLQENIRRGQRIEHFFLEVWENNNWKQVAEGTTVGYKRILQFPSIQSNRVRLRIDQCRLAPSIAEFGLYSQLPAVTANPSAAAFTESVKVVLNSSSKNSKIYYSTNGSIPNTKSHKYSKPLTLKESTELNYIAITNDGKTGFPGNSRYIKAKFGINLANSPDEKYFGGGPSGLVDGKKGSPDYMDGKWLGFKGTDLEAVIDLGKIKPLSEFEINFNENTKAWIFRPKVVKFFISEDGINFLPIYTHPFVKPGYNNEQVLNVTFTNACKARFVKVIATNFGSIPQWHPGKGEQAWLFADEIIIK